MSELRTSAAGLMQYAVDGSLATRIAEQLRMSGHGVGQAERRSWERSLPVLAQDLLDAGLDKVEILVEYQLPLTSMRIDAVLAGVHPKTGRDSFVVVELKQWSAVTSFDESSRLVSVDHVQRPRLHPGVQVAGYCDYLVDFLGALHAEPNSVAGVVYLHNALDAGVDILYDLPQTNRSRIFTKQRRGQFHDFLLARLAPQGGTGPADRFLSSSVRPSRLLLAHAADELQDRHIFTLLEEQRVAYELVLHAVDKARRGDRKKVVLVAGGPGSGKSVIALSLLGELARQGRPVLHATGSRSFTQTLRRYAGRGSGRMKGMFKYFNQFMTAERNGIDVLICDEAHRIRETSVDRFTPKGVRAAGRPQLDELLAAARVPVFLLDEHQVVKPGEFGRIDVITNHAERLGLDIEFVPLHGQFRCGGSEEYERWVLGLLALDDSEPFVWEGDGRFDLRLAESPEQMEAFLAAKQQIGETARISAGYCWPWSNPRPDGTLVADVQVGSWTRPWNLKSDRSIGDAPGSAYWATDPAGFGQVGCIYTAQGFEYEWSGVIIGPDLVVRDGSLVTRRSESKDPAFKSRQKVSDMDADRLIRNTYKVLLTRGMRGTMIYSTDPATREYFAELIQVQRGLETTYGLPRQAATASRYSVTGRRDPGLMRS
jgi:uncharacterized protein